jgi:hypothetical protein
MPAGSRTLLASGKRRIDATGRRVLSNASGPCCCPTCPDLACGEIGTLYCDCWSSTGGEICCYANNGTITIPFGTITPASGYESQPYADVLDDLIAEVSGQSVDFVLSPGNTSASFVRYGKISQIDGCNAVAWLLTVSVGFDSPGTLDMTYTASISIVGTNVGRPHVLGDPFPCTDANGTPTGSRVVTGADNFEVFLAQANNVAYGDCCGPGDAIVLDFINTDYIDDESIEVGPYTFDSECSPCDNSEFPETVDFDLSQCFEGLPTVSFNKIPDLGSVGLDYELNTSGMTGIYYWEIVGLIIPQMVEGTPTGEDCNTNLQCCFAIQYFMQVWDETDPENPVLVQTCDVTAYKCDGRLTVIGTYDVDGGGTVEVTATP